MGNMSKLSSCLRRVGGLDLSTLMNRKLLQKKVYFLQQFGVKLGYSYGFYIYGPYSSELSDDAYLLNRLIEGKSNAFNMKLTKPERDAIVKANRFFGEASLEKSELAKKLEIMSSLHFLWFTSFGQTRPIEDVFSTLKSKKSWVTRSELETGWALLQKYNLVE